MKLTIRLKGGPGSGHKGHAGRPGKHGGSLPGKGGVPTPKKGVSVIDAGGKPAHKVAEEIVSTHMDTIEREALRLGEELWGESSTGFIHQPKGNNYVDVHNPAKRVKLMGTSDEEGLLDPDMEYIFQYDQQTGKGSLLGSESGLHADMNITSLHVKQYYKRNPDKLLVSYHGDEGLVTVWKLNKVQDRRIARVVPTVKRSAAESAISGMKARERVTLGSRRYVALNAGSGVLNFRDEATGRLAFVTENGKIIRSSYGNITVVD